MKDRKVVLIAEDDPTLREALAYAFKNKGYTVEEAANGKIALQKCIANKPDCVVLDILMPQMTGIEMLEEVRSNSKIKDTNVVILTAAPPGDAMVKKAKKLGIQNNFTKGNVSLAKLISAVEDAIGS